ncbi:uncharacterized protein PHACADRAFT_263847 [Phanerochaete carnosa HHB-10118-sp]|uniref:Uncharacterized protein n=1 Tax=Phanerochaete carnosa (strain HHB-10118-sp) TaxID=650164 RepID=K5VUM7_PHACS|nr:uncharacterized protein PHACADRAFT_263847 [Phanerochaete carnosa HHB-10118-sp]EKM50515.1 hypothetical protein PHACADRAFT_263847 [Phanerochaete carnosa HHB-10118-sp]
MALRTPTNIGQLAVQDVGFSAENGFSLPTAAAESVALSCQSCLSRRRWSLFQSIPRVGGAAVFLLVFSSALCSHSGHRVCRPRMRIAHQGRSTRLCTSGCSVHILERSAAALHSRSALRDAASSDKTCHRCARCVPRVSARGYETPWQFGKEKPQASSRSIQLPSQQSEDIAC